MQNKSVHPQGCLHSPASTGTTSPSINVEGKEMLILPSNTLPFIWDFQSTHHWAFVLLMFRGPRRVEASLGNWYRQSSIIPVLKTMVWPGWTDQVHQRKWRQRNLHTIILMIRKPVLLPWASVLLTGSDWTSQPSSPHQRQNIPMK